MAELNEKIRIARTLAGFSQDEIAKYLEVQRSVVVRYEQERKPADSSLEKFATLTGMPLQWFWGRPLGGLLTFKPEMPGEEHSHVQIRQKETAITRDWPLFLALTGIKNLLILKCEFGGIVIAYNRDVCVLIFGTHTIDTIRRLSSSMDDLNVESIECEPTDFLNAWFQPKFKYLKKILKYGGEKFEAWWEDIEPGKPLGIFVDYHIECDLGTIDLIHDPGHSEITEKQIINVFDKLGFECTNVSIQRTSAVIKNAPPGWQFVKLTEKI